tara:strand:- start:186 stop:440 length:255 start_codon:yes stop_codon:yes gene_type:complete
MRKRILNAMASLSNPQSPRRRTRRKKNSLSVKTSGHSRLNVQRSPKGETRRGGVRVMPGVVRSCAFPLSLPYSLPLIQGESGKD